VSVNVEVHPAGQFAGTRFTICLFATVISSGSPMQSKGYAGLGVSKPIVIVTCLFGSFTGFGDQKPWNVLGLLAALA
jgi:hypothetical protein